MTTLYWGATQTLLTLLNSLLDFCVRRVALLPSTIEQQRTRGHWWPRGGDPGSRQVCRPNAHRCTDTEHIIDEPTVGLLGQAARVSIGRTWAAQRRIASQSR